MLGTKFPDKLDVRDLYRTDLSVRAKLLWMALSAECNSSGSCTRDISEVGALYGLEGQELSEALDELLRTGWLISRKYLPVTRVVHTVWLPVNPLRKQDNLEAVPFDPAPSAVNPTFRMEGV